jgi:hypothetical protein
MRRRLAAQLAEQAAEPEDLSTIDRTKDLMRRLLAVPKADVDALAAAEKHAKVRKRADASP